MQKIYASKTCEETWKFEFSKQSTLHNIDDSIRAITRNPISLYVQDRVDFRRIADPACDIRRRRISGRSAGGGDATCGNHGSGTHTPTPPGRRKSAPSFFFYIRERGKKNHRFSLRSTRRQLYESLPWSLDLRHISSDVLHDPSPYSLLRLLPVPDSFPSLPSAPRRAAREEDIIYFVN